MECVQAEEEEGEGDVFYKHRHSAILDGGIREVKRRRIYRKKART